MSRSKSAPSRTGLYLALVLVLFGLLLLAVVAYGYWRAQTTAPPATAGPPTPPAGPTAPATAATGNLRELVEVYFTAPRDPDRPEDRRGGLDERLTAFLKTATTSIDMAIYDLDLPNVTDALIDAKRRGVTVRVVTDTDNMQTESIPKLTAAAIKVVDDKRSAIMHHKFAVVDGSAVWMGSWNFTTFDTYRYNNNGALWRNRQLARAYTAEFDKLFAGQFGARDRKGPSAADVVQDERLGVRVEAHFTPEDDPAPAIVRRLAGARSSIVVLAFSFTHDDIGNAMLERSRQGVKVRGVFERTGSETAASEFGRFRQARLDVLQDGNRYLMHHKVIVIDERTVVFGSFNFSASAESNNENCLIVDSPELARLFLDEFERVYTQAATAAGR